MTCVMQVMSGTLPDTFIKAFDEHNKSVIGKHFPDEHKEVVENLSDQFSVLN